VGRFRPLTVTPGTWLTVLAFFVFVAPGLLYDLASVTKRTRRHETVFTEISRITLMSTLCSAGAAAVVTVIGMIVAARWEKYPFPDPASMIRGGSGYVNAHLAAVSWAAALCLGVSLGISYGAFRLVYRTDKAAISDISAWRSVLRDDLPDPGVAYALVKMKSGTVWGGRVAKYTPDPEMANRELVLSPPLSVRDAAASQMAKVPDKWMRVILPGPEIVSMVVTYGDPPP